MLSTNEIANLYSAYHYFICTSDTDEERRDAINDILHEEINKLDEQTKILIKESCEKQIPILTFDNIIRKRVLLEFALKAGLDIPHPFVVQDIANGLINYEIESCLVDRFDMFMTMDGKEPVSMGDYDIFLDIPKIDKRIKVVGGTCYNKNFN